MELIKAGFLNLKHYKKLMNKSWLILLVSYFLATNGKLKKKYKK